MFTTAHREIISEKNMCNACFCLIGFLLLTFWVFMASANWLDYQEFQKWVWGLLPGPENWLAVTTTVRVVGWICLHEGLDTVLREYCKSHNFNIFKDFLAFFRF